MNISSPKPPREDRSLPVLLDEVTGVEKSPALNIAGLERDGVPSELDIILLLPRYPMGGVSSWDGPGSNMAAVCVSTHALGNVQSAV